MAEGARLDQPSIIAVETGLRRELSQRQVVMISLGGAIGTGLFLSSGIAIGYAGPSVLISYAIAGFIAVVMVFSLSEMAVVHPAAGSFGAYAERYLNPWAGFVVRYTYWIAQVIAVGFEAIAAGLYMTWWFPGSPVWLWSIGFALIVLFVNSRSVHTFGSAEYWMSFIKVTAIVGFIILGAARVFGLGAPAVGLHNLYALPGGFFPHGLHGMWMAVILGVLSFSGIEIIAVTSGETADPTRAIPAALRTMAIRLFLFYVLALTVVIAIIPWTQSGASVQVSQSPFVKVLSMTGIPGAAGIMNFVIVSAALSSMNTDLYLCSRMLFSLSRGGYAPGALGRLNKRGVPMAATVVSGVFILAAASLSSVTPKAYSYLQGIALFGAIIVWMIILFSHFGFRRAHRAVDLPVRMPLYPWMQIAGLILLAALLVTMGLDKDWNTSWIVGWPFLGVLTIAYFLATTAAGSRRVSTALRLPSAADVEAARINIAGIAHRTPLWRLDVDDAPAEIYLKLENLQPLGSFKIRAGVNAMKALDPATLGDGVVGASAGNFGQGLAFAAKAMGVPVTIVAPDGAAETKVVALEALGATVIRVPFPEWWQTRTSRGYPGVAGVFVHPVAEDAVVAGNATIGAEIVEDMSEFDTVVAPFGGGGLACGIGSVLRRLRPNARMLAVENEGSNPAAAALAAGCPVAVTHRQSFVDGMGSGTVLPEMWPLIRQVVDGVVSVTLPEIADAIRLLAAKHHIIAEGAGAASVAAALAGRAGGGRVVCIVSGGNIDASVLAAILGGENPGFRAAA